MKKELEIAEIEAAIEVVAQKEKFSIEDVVKFLKSGKSQALKDRIMRTLDADDRYFGDVEGNYCSKVDYYRNFEFLITPDDWEIENKVLFPGHRFAPFVNPDVFPSEVKVVKPALVTKELHLPLSQIFHYCLLLGSEQIFDFLIAESPDNAGLSKAARATDVVTVNVFDMTEFYQKHDFYEGDAILCKVLDYEQGVVEFHYLSGEKRKEQKVREFIAKLEDALTEVICRFEKYLEIPEQLSYAFFVGGKGLKPEGSIDEFIKYTTQIEINFDAEHTVLACRSEELDDEFPVELPEGISISTGETSSLEDMLHEVGSPLTRTEVESFALDHCHQRLLEFDDFFVRAFGRDKLKFADAGQQAVFMNEVEALFEDIVSRYNRVDDDPKAALRASILEAVEDRMRMFDTLSVADCDLDGEVANYLKKLAEVSLQLTRLLDLINSPEREMSAAEVEELSETVAALTEAEMDIIDKIESV